MENQPALNEQVDAFMVSHQHNAWIGDNILQVYIRKGKHFINNTLYDTFDVANVVINDRKHRGKGYFKAFMLKAESLNLPVYVECIMNPDLVDMLKKNGYDIINGHSIHAFKLPKA